MRKVNVFKWTYDDDRKPVRAPNGDGKFHQFTTMHHFDGEQTTLRLVAIVERPNGNVETHCHMLIQFREE